MRTVIVIFVALLLTNLAIAGETSQRNVIGFSKDGQYFAFEEFGTLDGTGAPYSTIYAIDIKNDHWVAGSPVRVAGSEEESHAVEEALRKDGVTDHREIDQYYERALQRKREEAADLANLVLKPLGHFFSASQRAHNSPHEFTSDSKKVRFAELEYQQTLKTKLDSKVWRLELEETSLPASENCHTFYLTEMGFKLTLINEKSGEKQLLNNDKRVPKSRGCPQGYHIEEVLTLATDHNSFSLAVLIRYSKLGFEGPDGRLLAVTAQVTK